MFRAVRQAMSRTNSAMLARTRRAASATRLVKLATVLFVLFEKVQNVE